MIAYSRRYCSLVTAKKKQKTLFGCIALAVFHSGLRLADLEFS